MSVRIEHGDCLEVMARLREEGVLVDSIVTDAPYHLTSIVKRFGKDDSAPAKSNGQTGVYGRAAAGFMGQKWDGGDVAFRPETWRLAFDLLKPGGHMLVFGGTRTYHRLACAIEDAGFEIRDQIQWLYGSGFPKSHNVSKGIDKAAGQKGSLGDYRTPDHAIKRKPGNERQHEGYQRPWRDDPEAEDRSLRRYIPATEDAREWQGWGTALKPACEPIVLARKPLEGTVAANVLEHGTGALNIDGCRMGIDAEERDTIDRRSGRDDGKGNSHLAFAQRPDGETFTSHPQGRWPANVIHDGSEEVLEAFAVSGESYGSGGGMKDLRKGALFQGKTNPNITDHCGFGDTGTAARFFYSSKADASDRLGSKHPTVKPVDLMAYLCRLITPPGGLVLDPFAGSGTTAMAALREGFDAILIEKEARFVADIRHRLAHVEGADTPLFQGTPP